MHVKRKTVLTMAAAVVLVLAAAFGLAWGMISRSTRLEPIDLTGVTITPQMGNALSMEPELLVADEPIASLDVSIQAQIVNLFRHLQREHGFSILFIAHDLAMVEFLCDRVGVLYHGRMVESAPTSALFQRPLHPYTQALLSAIPIPDPRLERSRTLQTFSPDMVSLDGVLVEEEPDHFVLREGGRP